MEAHTYKVVEVIGSSPVSWEEAARNAIGIAGKHLQDLRIAEVIAQDMQIKDGTVLSYRVKMKVSFRYHSKEELGEDVPEGLLMAT